MTNLKLHVPHHPDSYKSFEFFSAELGEVVKFTLEYHKRRGYFAKFTPVRLEAGGVLVWEMFGKHKDRSTYLLLGGDRFNFKTLTQLATLFDNSVPYLVALWLKDHKEAETTVDDMIGRFTELGGVA
jgi:hypothetical protein